MVCSVLTCKCSSRALSVDIICLTKNLSLYFVHYKVPSGRDDAGVHTVHVVIDASMGMASYTCDFSQLKVPDLKHFLKISGIPHSGKGKDDLVQLCIAAQPCYAEIEPCDHEVSGKKRYWTPLSNSTLKFVNIF